MSGRRETQRKEPESTGFVPKKCPHVATSAASEGGTVAAAVIEELADMIARAVKSDCGKE
jgi:hypothetical protein